MTILTAILLALQPANPEPVEDRVDIMEVNHFYDEAGKLVFNQLIFYCWCDCACRNQVIAWRLVNNVSQLPLRDWKRGGYVAVWRDGEILRRVHSQAYRETWTQHDPELAEREVLPKESRRELGKPSN